MCRIAGIIDKNQDTLQLEIDINAMCQTMAHGGPDDEGFFYKEKEGITFGHRRLALIDLTEAGHQPMTYHKRFTITFNGEIYNYLELKSDLREQGFYFKTESDTEVILAGFAYWGTKVFEKLIGMFAFAIYDHLKNLSYLVRDSSGIKPLYYSILNQRLIFASEVKAFSKTSINFVENEDWPIYLLAFGHIPEPITTLKDVLMLPKSHYLEWNHQHQKAEIICFYKEDYEAVYRNQKHASLQIKAGLEVAVKRHLIAEAPIGVFLSGGIDSSIITLLANCIQKQQYQALHTISVNFAESQFSEKSYQELIASQIKSIHHEHQLDEITFNKHLSNAIASMDQPTTDGINSWFVNYMAKENGLKAVLSGIGGDELFGGYPSFKRMKVISLLSQLPRILLSVFIYANSPSLKRFYYLSYKNTLGKYLFLRGFFTPDDIALLLNISRQKVEQILNNLPSPPIPTGLKTEEQASWLETNMYMQNQLLKDTDAMSMCHGIEVRVPFLDNEFKKIVLKIDSDIKFKTQIQKGLLIHCFKELLPKNIWNRPKMGFTFPFQHWLRKNTFFVEGLSKLKGKRANQLLKQFKDGDLHWSKAMALYQITRKPLED